MNKLSCKREIDQIIRSDNGVEEEFSLSSCLTCDISKLSRTSSSRFEVK